MRVVVLWCVASLSSAIALAQTPADPGRQTFVSRCAGCHGTTGNGGELGPAIDARIPTRTDQDLAALLREGVPGSGMPAFAGLTSTEAGPHQLPAHAAAAERLRAGTRNGRAHGRRHVAVRLAELQRRNDRKPL